MKKFGQVTYSGVLFLIAALQYGVQGGGSNARLAIVDCVKLGGRGQSTSQPPGSVNSESNPFSQ